MSYFLNGFGIVIGVIAGTVITILLQLWMQRRAETQQKQNLKFELQFDIQKIDTWLEKLVEYRNAVNGNALDTHFGYFDISQVISVTIRTMLESGLLYRTLTHSRIGELLTTFSEFTISGEQFINNQFAQAKLAFEGYRAEERMADWEAEGKPEAVRNIDYWERKLNSHKNTLTEIAKSIK